MANIRLAQQRQNGCILTLAIIVIIIIAIVWLVRGCEKRQEAKAPKSAMEMAFKPTLPEPDEEQAIAACDRVVYGVISNPERAAMLVSGKYALTIQKSGNEQALKGRLPVNQKTRLTHSLQGITMIESGGASLPTSGVGAKGVVQMLASTARQHGLKVTTDTARVNRLLAKARAGNADSYVELARIDERFDPYKCIRGGADFLVTLYNHYGRWDFTVAAYHGGQGNVDKLIATYISGNFKDLGTPKKNIEAYGLTYAKIFFDNSPQHNPATYRFMCKYRSAAKDFSGWYFWNVTAAQRAVEMYQHNRQTFRQTSWNWKHLTDTRRRELMPEIVWYPKGCEVFAGTNELNRAYTTGELVPAPQNAKIFGYRLDSSIGEAVAKNECGQLRGARPETIGLLMTLAYLTRQESGHWNESLIVTALVRSTEYQDKLRTMKKYRGRAAKRSIHTAGHSIDFSRTRYESDAQRAGFQYALDYLRACGDICYAKEGNDAIHVTLSPRSEIKFRIIYEDGTEWEIRMTAPELRTVITR